MPPSPHTFLKLPKSINVTNIKLSDFSQNLSLKVLLQRFSSFVSPNSRQDPFFSTHSLKYNLENVKWQQANLRKRDKLYFLKTSETGNPNQTNPMQTCDVLCDLVPFVQFNLKDIKNTHGRVLLLAKLQAYQK